MPYGGFHLSYNGSQTGWLHTQSSASQVQSALQALPGLGVGNVTVTAEDLQDPYGYYGPNGRRWTVTFGGSLAATNVSPIGIQYDYNYDYPNVSATTTVQGSNVGTNEQQTVALPGVVSGTFQLVFGGQASGAIAANAPAAQVQTALEGLSSIGAGNVSVSGAGTLASPYLVTFQGTLGSQNVAQLTAAPASLVGGTITASTDVTGSLGLEATRDAAEGGQAGYFRVFRSGATNNPLTVYYTIDAASTASGSDYSYLYGSLTIPAGQASALINVTAQDD
jgi:trimeric autotransporter adhesin